MSEISPLAVARRTRHPAAEALQLDAAVRAPEGLCEQGQYGCFHAHSVGDGGHGGVGRQHQRCQGVKGQVSYIFLETSVISSTSKHANLLQD